MIIILIAFELTWNQHPVGQVMWSAFFPFWLLQTQYHQPAILGFTVALSWFLLYSNDDCDYYFLDHDFCDQIWNAHGKHYNHLKGHVILQLLVRNSWVWYQISTSTPGCLCALLCATITQREFWHVLTGPCPSILAPKLGMPIFLIVSHTSRGAIGNREYC